MHPSSTNVVEDRRRAAVVCGLWSALWAFVVPAAGSLRTDYSQTSQYISELGARGEPLGSVVSIAGFGVTGLLVLAYLWLARPELPVGALTTIGVVCFAGVGVAYLVAAVFRCDPGCPGEGSLSQSIHSTSGLSEYLGALIGLLLLAAAFWRAPAWRGAAVPSVVAALLVAIGFLGMLRPSLQSWRGSSQRIADGAIFVWIAWVSLRLWRGTVLVASPRVSRDASRRPIRSAGSDRPM
jgi:hypothetical protein